MLTVKELLPLFMDAGEVVVDYDGEFYSMNQDNAVRALFSDYVVGQVHSGDEREFIFRLKQDYVKKEEAK